MTKTPEVISRVALLETLRGLGINPAQAKSITITYDGVDVENFVYGANGQKLVTMHPDGSLEPEIEDVHIRFVD